MRHRELARQATEWCVNNAKGAPTAWEWEDKFAELLLQECVMIAKLNGFEYSEKQKDVLDFELNNIYAEGAISAAKVANEIRENFGMNRSLKIDK